MTHSNEQQSSPFQDENSVGRIHHARPTEDDTRASPAVDYEHVSVPVLIIGAGAAGARTAIELAKHDVEPLVVGKRAHGDAHTTLAAGGINAALGNRDPEDDWQIHAADTLKEGHFINDPDGVETVTNAMPDRIRELEEWGMSFNRTEDEKIEQRYFGAQSFRRTCFVGDSKIRFPGRYSRKTKPSEVNRVSSPVTHYLHTNFILHTGCGGSHLF